jgi:putative MATE family efflux protein
MKAGPAKDFTTGPVLPAMVRFALPLTAADVLSQGYLVVDSAVLGNFAGARGLAAVGAAFPVFYLPVAVFVGMVGGFSIRIGQLTGSGRPVPPTGAVAMALALFTLGWAAATFLVAVAAAGPAMAVMGVTGQVAADGRTFLLVISAGSVAVFAQGAVIGYLRGLGDATVPMILVAVSNGLNMVLAWLFVGPFGLGVGGAAGATVLASVVAAVAGVRYVLRRHRSAPVRPPKAEVATELVAATRLGGSIAVQHVAIALGIMALIWVVAPYGTQVLAASTIVGRLELFAGLVFVNLSGALTIFVAQNSGAGNAERIRRGVSECVAAGLALTAVASAVLVTQRSTVAALFTTDPELRALTARYLLITFPFFALYTYMVLAHGGFNGVGRTVVPLICTVLSFLVVRIPLSYLLGLRFGIDGLMWAVVLGWLVGAGYTMLAAGRRPIARLAG